MWDIVYCKVTHIIMSLEKILLLTTFFFSFLKNITWFILHDTLIVLDIDSSHFTLHIIYTIIHPTSIANSYRVVFILYSFMYHSLYQMCVVDSCIIYDVTKKGKMRKTGSCAMQIHNNIIKHTMYLFIILYTVIFLFCSYKNICGIV